jgi:hypothetical protein
MPEMDLTAWEKLAIPAWRRILQEAIEQKDQRREKYARYILGDVLKVKVEEDEQIQRGVSGKLARDSGGHQERTRLLL